jgi:hypothetical protein
MPLGAKIDRVGLPRESELRACLRRYKNDSLIAWHLGIPKAEVAAARAKYKPPRALGTYVKESGNMDDLEFRRRQEAAARSNSAFLKAIERCRG